MSYIGTVPGQIVAVNRCTENLFVTHNINTTFNLLVESNKTSAVLVWKGPYWIGSRSIQIGLDPNVDVSISRRLIDALKRRDSTSDTCFGATAVRETTSRYFGAQFEEGLRITPRRAIGMCCRSWAGWFSGHGVPERPEKPSWSSARFWDSTTHSAWNCSLPSLRRSSVRRMLLWCACVRTCMYTYTLRLHHARMSVRSSAIPRLGYKVGILRVPVVSCRPLGDRTKLRKVGACTGTFLSATYVVEELGRSSSLADYGMPRIPMGAMGDGALRGCYVRGPR